MENNFVWNVEAEIALFDAMTKYKPVGINKHFKMIGLVERFSQLIQKEVNSATVWQHLESLYDMSALDELETVPIPSIEKIVKNTTTNRSTNKSVIEFQLPSDQFCDLMKLKNAVPAIEEKQQKEKKDDAATNKRQSKNRAEERVSRRSEEHELPRRRAPKRAAARDSSGKSGSPAPKRRR